MLFVFDFVFCFSFLLLLLPFAFAFCFDTDFFLRGVSALCVYYLVLPFSFLCVSSKCRLVVVYFINVCRCFISVLYMIDFCGNDVNKAHCKEVRVMNKSSHDCCCP